MFSWFSINLHYCDIRQLLLLSVIVVFTLFPSHDIAKVQIYSLYITVNGPVYIINESNLT